MTIKELLDKYGAILDVMILVCVEDSNDIENASDKYNFLMRHRMEFGEIYRVANTTDMGSMNLEDFGVR